jgi:RHS repeat-associated protein
VFVLDRSQRARVQKFPRVVAAVVSLALLATALEARQPAEAAPAADPQPAAQKVGSRPDVISASVTARSQGSRVEVESMRTETSTTWSNPDGTMTTDAHAAPIRFKTAKGAWQSIDLTLQKNLDGTVAPRGHEHGLRLGKRNATAGQVFASATSGAGRQVEWLAPWKLPEPTLDGTRATYADVQPGVDLVMDARRNGFEHDFIVKQRPAVTPVWRIPLRTKGLTAKPQADGTISFVDSKNVVRSRIPVSYMWDAVTAPTGDPANKAVVKVTVEQVSPGKATLVIAPDAKWFLDPTRVFPVTVDPTYVTGTLKSTFDTWVQSGVTTDQSDAVDLRVGKNGTATARSFMNFATSTFAGKDILSASISLWQYGAVSCTPTVVYVRSATPATTATRWTSQPTLGTVYGQVSAAKGATGCAGGRISIPMTTLAQAWSNASYPTGGLALTAANEADVNSWKRFYSFAGIADPYVTMTWNRPPATPAVVETSEAVGYAAPGETASSMYSSSLRPWVRTKGTDPDGNTVKYVFEIHTSPVGPGSLKGTCTSSVYASGTTAGCRPSTDLPDNTLLYVRAKANDGRVDGPWTTSWARLRVGTQAPSAPVISCPAPYVINSWQDNAPTADVECTVTATGTSFSAPGYIRLTVDGKAVPTNFTGGAAGQIKITPSSDPAIAKTTVKLPKNVPGLHRITAQAETPAGKLSSSASYSFGWGSSSLSSPTATPRITTTGAIKIAAAGPPRGQSAVPTAKIRWRLSGYAKDGQHDTVGWNVDDETALTVTDNGTAGVTVTGLWDTNKATVDANVDADPSTPAIEPTTLNDRVPVMLDVQVCITYASSSQCTWSQTPNTTVQRVPHAFGNGFPTAEAGPGQVALWTGEFATEATDLTVPGYSGDLSISRSHATYAGETNVVNGVFGPGWVGQFEGAEVGSAGLEVVDSTLVDGTIALVDGEGTALVFEAPDGRRRVTAAFATGTWPAADEITRLDGSKLTISGAGSGLTIRHTESDGAATTWVAAAAPTASAAASFRATGISQPGLASQTTFSYDAAGRVARILAPTPPGVICPASGPLVRGCRAVRFDYAPSGDDGERLMNAWLDIYNPAKAGGAGMDSIKVAAYSYDTNGRLVKVTDPRSNLATEYGYDAKNQLTLVKPPGQVPFELRYLTVGPQDRLAEVRRDRPAGDPTGGTAVLGQFVYDVPLSGAALPDMSAQSVARWNQKATPTKGFAVFGPDRPTTGTPGPEDWKYADLQYTDASGYTVNTAKYGAGNWQLTATDFNEQGQVVRQLDQRALRVIVDDQLPAGVSDQLASLTIYNGEIKDAAGEVLTPAGTLITDRFGPATNAALQDGSVRWVRPRSHFSYDEHAPNAGVNSATGMPYRLQTSETSSVADPATNQDVELISRTLTDYNPPVPGDPDGWAVGQAGLTITDADFDGEPSSADVVTLRRYDTQGRIIEERQPASDGTDAGTVRTTYYTAAANTTRPECGNRAEWAGLACITVPAATPRSTNGVTPALPTTFAAAFNYLLDPTKVIETSGVTTRTVDTTYALDGAVQTTKTTVVGLADSTPIPEKETSYDAQTGQVSAVTAKNADNSTSSVSTGYDGWGRQVSYQQSGDQPTTATYDSAGRPSVVTDPNGSTKYSYDGIDAAGREERRGLPTKLEVTSGGSTWISSGGYDSSGLLTTQKVPGGITRSNEFDIAGDPTAVRYSGAVTTVNEDGSTTTEPDGAWLAWSFENDVLGRVAHEWTPDGVSFEGPSATAYDRAYRYDSVGRLSQVRERVAAPGGDPQGSNVPCLTRSYSFDKNDNRVEKLSATSAEGGECPTSGGTASTREFDSADRPVTGANGSGSYMYDALGRTRTIPAADAPFPLNGALDLDYYDNDRAKSITQGAVTTAFTLDAMDRRLDETTTGGPESVQIRRHYTDTSDNPTWITQGPTSQRYAQVIGGGLGLVVSQDGTARLTLTNLHGDVVTTTSLQNGSAVANGIEGWNAYEEYGAGAGATSTGALSYGWLGANKRSTVDSGLMLMGARLYNPATGIFTSRDPVAGGNANSYTYPTDPVNMSDPTGCACKNGRKFVVGGGVVWKWTYGKWKHVIRPGTFIAWLFYGVTGSRVWGAAGFYGLDVRFRVKVYPYLVCIKGRWRGGFWNTLPDSSLQIRWRILVGIAEGFIYKHWLHTRWEYFWHT